MNKRTGIIACAGVFILIMVMLFSRSCSIRRNEMVQETNQIDENGNIIEQGVNEEQGDSEEKVGYAGVDEDENNGVGVEDTGNEVGKVGYDDSEEVGSLDGTSVDDKKENVSGEASSQGSSEQVQGTNEETTENTSSSEEKKYEISLKKASKVTIVKSGSCEATVVGKNVYLTDEYVYSYCLNLKFTMEDGTETSIDYLCSVFTWNYVNTGDTVTLNYGLDSDGNLLVKSLMNSLGVEF